MMAHATEDMEAKATGPALVDNTAAALAALSSKGQRSARRFDVGDRSNARWRSTPMLDWRHGAPDLPTTARA